MSGVLGALDIAASGLQVQSERLTAISSNLANANSTAARPEDVYRKKDVLVQAIPAQESFSDVMTKALSAEDKLQRAQVVEVAEDTRPPKMVYNPSHPHANAEGYVATPNVSYVEEMANMLEASRSYEANLAVIDAIKLQTQKALEIGR